jgi:hypothetical protein
MRKGWSKYEGMQMDAEGYVSRPIAPADLKRIVTRILESTGSRQLRWREVLEQEEKHLVHDLKNRGSKTAADFRDKNRKAS